MFPVFPSLKMLWERRSPVFTRVFPVFPVFPAKKQHLETGETCGIVHAFVKKSQKTPKKDLDLARTRMKEVSQ